LFFICSAIQCLTGEENKTQERRIHFASITKHHISKGRKTTTFKNKAVTVCLLVHTEWLSSQRSPGDHVLPAQTEQKIIKNNINQ